MSSLKIGRINFNDIMVLKKVKQEIQNLVGDTNSYYDLDVNKKSFYFTTITSLPPKRGWYIILYKMKPIYVGRATNLNSRLSTRNGSLDNFKNRSRKFDSKRNFIKKFIELMEFKRIKVCIIQEHILLYRLNLKGNQLSTIDRGNIEKFIDIFRSEFKYL